jgi:ferredoxin-NADP reductase
VWWIHTTHDTESIAFSAEVDELIGRLPSAHAFVYYTSPTRQVPRGQGVRTGRLTTDELAALDLPVDADAYVCGPGSFMDDVAVSLTGLGIDPARIHNERFGSVSAVNPGVVATATPRPHQPDGPPGSGPAVSFARSGLSAAWSDAYSSVLELAEACDVPTQWACRSGVCHTCVTALFSGEATYTTPPLEPPGEDELLICSARPATDLVIDL